MGPEFFQTGMGRKFYEADVPRIAKGIERLAAAVEKQNELMERCLQLQVSPDSLKTLTGPFMTSEGDEREVPQRNLNTELCRWHATYASKSVKAEHVGELYHLLMNKLPFMVAQVDSGESEACEAADRVVLQWVQEHTSLETDGKSYRALAEMVTGFITDEIENAERAFE